MLRKRSFRARLIAMYSLLMIAIIASSFTGFYVYYRSLTYDTVRESFEKEADNLSQQVDNIILIADRLILQIKNNPVIQDTFYYIQFSQDPSAYFNSNETTAYQIKDILNSITGVDTQIYNRASIISKSGAYITLGAFYDRNYAENRFKELNWFDRLQTDYNILLPPHRDDWDPTGRTVISLIRKIESGGHVHSVVEFQLPYSSLEAVFDSGSEPYKLDGGKRVALLQADGTPIYPLQPVLAASGGKRHMEVRKQLRHSNWTLVISQPEDELLKPIRRSGILFAATAFGLMLVSLTAIYASTSRAVKPLALLSSVMSEMHIDNRKEDSLNRLFARLDVWGTHNEVVHLYHAFRRMVNRLEESKQMAIEAQTREIQANFAALQAQMNPHFLYNTLSIIGMMGREAGNEEILEATSKLVRMFRYVTYPGKGGVTLREELDHALDYLNIMELRYREHLHFHIRTEGDLNAVRLPKLTLQPLVENCIKHGFAGKKYPWTIEMDVAVTDTAWQVSIRDDGVGFEPSFLHEFQQKKDMRKHPSLSGPPQDGIGILSTYARLFYVFGNELQLKLENRDTGGASVSIVGPALLGADEDDSYRRGG